MQKHGKINFKNPFFKPIILLIILLIILSLNQANSKKDNKHSDHKTNENKGEKKIPLDSNTKKMVLQFNNYEIPANETTYACKNFDIANELQQITNKAKGTAYHAIAFEPEIDQAEFLHHLIVMSCDKDIKITNEIYSCPLSTTRDCLRIQFEWGLGSGNYILPENVGVLWGVAENKKIVMQFHYNNPDLKKGVKDSSAINVYFTPKLRKYDSATMVLGAAEELISIPPKQKAFKVSNICDATCTRKINDSIYVFAVFLHGHTFLRKIKTEIHYENGTVDDTTLREDHFVFNDQKYVYLDKPIKISPGDQMKTICEYDTSKTNRTVKGGESTSDEMCYSFMNFYPRESGVSLCIGGYPESDLGCAKFKKYLRKKAAKGKLKKKKKD